MSGAGSRVVAGGVGFQPINVHDYFEEMIRQVDEFDREQRDRPAPRAGAAWIGEWQSFLLTPADGAPVYRTYPPYGWRTFVQQHSGPWDKLLNSDEVMSWIGGYERRLLELRAQWRELGGEPTSPEPVEGFRPAEGASSLPGKLEGFADRLTTIGLFVALGYLVSSIGGLRRGH